MFTHTVPALISRYQAKRLGQIICPDTGAQAVGGIVHEVKQFFLCVVGEEGRNRPERLFIQQGVASRVRQKDGRLNVATWTINYLATVDNGAVLSPGRFKEASKFLLVLLVGDWAELRGLSSIGEPIFSVARRWANFSMIGSICDRCAKKRSAAAQI